MLRARLLTGSILSLLTLLMLAADRWWAPWYPLLALFVIVVVTLSVIELHAMMPLAQRLPRSLYLFLLLILLSGNWLPVLGSRLSIPLDPLRTLCATALLSTSLLLGLQMARFQHPGHAITQLGWGLFILFYLGVLPSFLIQIRWLPLPRLEWLLTTAIFIPKCGDIGAYFFGRMFGRHALSKILSPKKTWEGFAGGLVVSILVAVILHERLQLFPGGLGEAFAFGLILGLVGVFGDLAESLLKRDCFIKDASQSIPGFGGILDVIDSLMFAGPVAYFWFSFHVSLPHHP